MNREILLTVEKGISPTRIDKYLADRLSQISRSRIQQLIDLQFILLNGYPVTRSKEKIHTGDRITIHLPPPLPSQVEPEAIPIEILYEDNDIAVVNKPAGLCVHPTEQRTTGTLVNGLLYHIHDLSGIGGVLRPGIVHRLDRVTSGIVLIAKNDVAHHRLSESFKNRQIEKVYWAIVHGAPPALEGEINQPIGRHPRDRKRMAIRSDGRNSLTRYRILHTALGGTLLAVYPKTGRTHQIRVHLRHLGLSIVRDSLYGLKKHLGKGTLERLFEGYPGIALHAKDLRFTHPVTGLEIEFHAPLPGIFQSVVDQMICHNPHNND